MKRLLSVILSFSLMFALTSNISEAGTAGLNSQKKFSAVSSKDGRSFCIKGENCSPYININNNNEAIANSSSKSSSTSNGVGSEIGQKILLGLAFFLGWKAYSLKNSIGVGFSAAIDKATGWFQNFGGNNQSETDQNSGQNGSQGNSGSETDQGSGQNGNQDDLGSENNQSTATTEGKGPNKPGSPDLQTNAETEGSARVNWSNFSLNGALLGLDYYIKLATSKIRRSSSIDQMNPIYQTIL